MRYRNTDSSITCQTAHETHAAPVAPLPRCLLGQLAHELPGDTLRRFDLGSDSKSPYGPSENLLPALARLPKMPWFDGRQSLAAPANGWLAPTAPTERVSRRYAPVWPSDLPPVAGSSFPELRPA